jgi:hypothetical protein
MGNDIDDWAGRSDRARRGRQRANRAADGFIPPADGDRVGVGGCDEEGRFGRDASGEIILLIVDSSERYFLAVGAIFWTFYLVAPVDC